MKKTADEWNEKWSTGWEDFLEPIRKIMLPLQAIEQPMAKAGCQLTYDDLGFTREMYNQAVCGARFLRDRFTILDLADDAGLLTGAFS